MVEQSLFSFKTVGKNAKQLSERDRERDVQAAMPRATASPLARHADSHACTLVLRSSPRILFRYWTVLTLFVEIMRFIVDAPKNKNDDVFFFQSSKPETGLKTPAKQNGKKH